MGRFDGTVTMERYWCTAREEEHVVVDYDRLSCIVLGRA